MITVYVVGFIPDIQASPGDMLYETNLVNDVGRYLMQFVRDTMSVQGSFRKDIIPGVVVDRESVVQRS